MGKKENVYPYTDLLAYADRNKICGWNEAIDLMKDAGLVPFYELSSKVIYPDEDREEDGRFSEHPQLQQIIKGFCEQEKIDFITIIDS